MRHEARQRGRWRAFLDERLSGARPLIGEIKRQAYRLVDYRSDLARMPRILWMARCGGTRLNDDLDTMQAYDRAAFADGRCDDPDPSLFANRRRMNVDVKRESPFVAEGVSSQALELGA